MHHYPATAHHPFDHPFPLAAGCDALAAALRTGAMPSCEGLCVAGNPFTARGREALLEAAAQGSPGLSVFLE